MEGEKYIRTRACLEDQKRLRLKVRHSNQVDAAGSWFGSDNYMIFLPLRFQSPAIAPLGRRTILLGPTERIFQMAMTGATKESAPALGAGGLTLGPIFVRRFPVGASLKLIVFSLNVCSLADHGTQKLDAL
jgi:hypothetical protein